MQNLVVKRRIVAGELSSPQFLTDDIALSHLIIYRERGLKPVVRRSKHDWMAFVVTDDESSTVLVADGYRTEEAAAAAARDAWTILVAA
jgi:hypothetical protein